MLLTPLDCQADKLPTAVPARIIQQDDLTDKGGIDILARMIQVLPTTQSTRWLVLSCLVLTCKVLQVVCMPSMPVRR